MKYWSNGKWYDIQRIESIKFNGSESSWRLYKTTNNGYKYALNKWANLLDKNPDSPKGLTKVVKD